MNDYNELNVTFDQYMAEFKKLSIEKKRDEIINSLKELIVLFEELSRSENLQVKHLKSREINDLKNNNVSEDDFLEGELVYIEDAKNMIGTYLDYKIR